MLKIMSLKKYREMEEELKVLREYKESYMNVCEYLDDLKLEHKKEIEDLNKLYQIAESRRATNVAKIGGLSKENNRLREKIKELNAFITEFEGKIKALEEEIKKLNSNRYVLKKLAPGKMPKSHIMKISPSVKPAVQKYQRENQVD